MKRDGRTHKPRRALGPPATAPRARLFNIAGLQAVQALFATDPDRVERLFFDDRTAPLLGAACARMAAARKPYRKVTGEELERILGSPLHGGAVAVAAPRKVLPFDVNEAATWAAAGQPLLILDGVGNPHNLGAIVRTAAFFGLRRILLSGHPAQALPSESAYRVAEGGFEYVTLARTPDLAAALTPLARHYRVLATALGGHPPPVALGSVGSGPPPAIILGNEETGCAAATLKACAEIVTIPGSGDVQSLNVSATAAILIHEMMRERVRGPGA